MQKPLTSNCLKTSLVLLIVIMLSIGCGQKETEPAGPTEISFITNYQEALQTAQDKDQKILIDFYTDWCYWCKVLDSATYSDPSVIAMSQEIVFAKIDAEADTITADKYSIVGFPTIVLIENDGTEIDRIGGYLPPDEFIEEVNNYLQGIGTLADLLKKSQSEPSAGMYMDIADKYSSRAKFDEAIDYYRKVIDFDPENKAGFTDKARLEIGRTYARQEEYKKARDHYTELMVKFAGKDLEKSAMFAMGDTYLYQDLYDKAYQQYQKIIGKFENDEVACDAMFRIGYIHREQGDTAKALGIYQEILTKFPNSPDTTYALDYIAKLNDTTKAAEEES